MRCSKHIAFCMHFVMHSNAGNVKTKTHMKMNTKMKIKLKIKIKTKLVMYNRTDQTKLNSYATLTIEPVRDINFIAKLAVLLHQIDLLQQRPLPVLSLSMRRWNSWIMSRCG